MANHIHLIVKPKKKSNLGKAIGEVHRRYTQMINLRENWKSYLWQKEGASYRMDKGWLLKAVAYVELNPVKSRLVKKAWDYRWSSVHAHLDGENRRRIILPEKLLSLAGDWKTYLQESQGSSGIEFEQHGRTGRPLGSERFIEKAGRLLQRDLKKKKPGPKGGGDNKYCVPLFFPGSRRGAEQGEQIIRVETKYLAVIHTSIASRSYRARNISWGICERAHEINYYPGVLQVTMFSADAI